MIYQSLPQSECRCRLLSRSRGDPSLSLKGHDALEIYLPSWKRHSGGLLSEVSPGMSVGLRPPSFFQNWAELPDGSGEYSWRRRTIPSGRDTRLLLSSCLWKQSKSRLWVWLENSWCCAYKYPCSFHLWTLSQLQRKLPVQYPEDVSTSKWVAQQPACWVRSCLVSRVC